MPVAERRRRFKVYRRNVEHIESTNRHGRLSYNDKLLFIEELRQLSRSVNDRWLLLGDFNLFCKASDKSETDELLPGIAD
jgi:hypothetical protein